MTTRTFLRLSILLALPLASTATLFARAGDRPALVLFLIVDQLRGDTLPAQADRLSERGLGGLLERGVFYANAHYRHATTYTSVGHATLITGAGPQGHGIVGNDWYSLRDRRQIYSCDDPRRTLLGEDAKAPYGSSPRNLIGSTLGDELVAASGGRSRVFAVSGKDRGAILTAGRLGQAYWYSKASGRFITSTYYQDAYPAWVARSHDAGVAASLAGQSWTLRDHPATYTFLDQDDRPYERPPSGFSRVFPHDLPGSVGGPLFSAIRTTPYLDELTVDFARALLLAEHVGQGDHPDMLVVSLSATDYIGHAFGPLSLEAEDNLRHLDRSIATLLAAVDQAVGLDRTLIVLSSDHGVDLAPEHHNALRGHPHRADDASAAGSDLHDLEHDEAGRHQPDQLRRTINQALRDRFQIDRDLVIEFWNPSFYLDEDAITELQLDLTQVEDVAAEALRAVPGIARAFTRRSLLDGTGPHDPIAEKVRRSFHPDRSGHLLVVQEPFWYLNPEMNNAAMHGSPYTYDTHVPILIVAPGVTPRTVYRRVGPEDIASTLAAALAVSAPSGSDGDPLFEVLERGGR